MHITQQQEQFSRAYVQAIAAVAGFAHCGPSVDDDSIDMGLMARRQVLPTAPRIDMQLKCTGGEILIDAELPFDLSLKNYDDLRAETLVPRILVVVLVPKDINDWVVHQETSLALFRCGYWMSLSGFPATINKDSKRVHLPRTQLFNVQSMQDLMSRADQGVPL